MTKEQNENSVNISVLTFGEFHCLSFEDDENKTLDKYNDYQIVKYSNPKIFLHFEKLKIRVSIYNFLLQSLISRYLFS